MKSRKVTDGRPLWVRMIRSAGRTSLTLSVIAGAGALGAVGYSALESQAAMRPMAVAAPLTQVSPTALTMQSSVSVQRRFTGQFEAAQEVALSFEEGGTLNSVLVREGDVVEKGAVVARLDQRLLMAERARLVASKESVLAQAELAKRTNTRQQRLVQEGHVSEQRLDQTSLTLAQLDASVAEIDAAIAALDVRLEKAVLRAPFAGRVGTRTLDTGAVAGPGASVLTIVEDAPPRFRASIDPALTDTLMAGDTFGITSKGITLRATLTEMSPELDPATRSRLAYFDILPGQSAPVARATGEITLTESRPGVGAWVPLTALKQGPNGTWTLLTLSDHAEGRAVVTVEAAEVLHLTDSRAFVRGTFGPETMFIPSGGHRVVPGETVTLSEDF